VLLVAVLAGLKLAVTPFGRADTVKLTLPLKPFCPLTVRVLEPLLPLVKLSVFGDAARVNVGTVTVTPIEAVLLTVPYVPVMVTLDVPAATELPAVNVTVLALALVAGLKDAVTPFGRPAAAKLTVPLKPFCAFTARVVLALVPGVTVIAVGVAASVNVGTTMVTLTVVALLSVPAVPVTVTVEVPAVAALDAIRESVPGLLAVAGVNEAVTPFGRPAAAKLILPVKPFCGVTVRALLVLLPGLRLRALGDAESVKLGTVIVRSIVAVLFRVPDVPVTVTLVVPPTAALLAVSVSVLELPVLAGLNAAVTPFGRPAAARLTLALKLFSAFTVIVPVPLPPAETERLLAEVDKVNAGEAGAELRSLIRDWPVGVPQPVTKS
jgi:hypothetical protein